MSISKWKICYLGFRKLTGKYSQNSNTIRTRGAGSLRFHFIKVENFKTHSWLLCRYLLIFTNRHQKVSLLFHQFKWIIHINSQLRQTTSLSHCKFNFLYFPMFSLIFTVTKQNQENLKRKCEIQNWGDKADLELLEEEDWGGVSLEAEIELEAAIKEAYGPVVAADHYLSSATWAVRDVSTNFLRDRALSSVFLLEEIEFPPLVHFLFERSNGSRLDPTAGWDRSTSAIAQLLCWRCRFFGSFSPCSFLWCVLFFYMRRCRLVRWKEALCSTWIPFYYE